MDLLRSALKLNICFILNCIQYTNNTEYYTSSIYKQYFVCSILCTVYAQYSIEILFSFYEVSV